MSSSLMDLFCVFLERSVTGLKLLCLFSVWQRTNMVLERLGLSIDWSPGFLLCYIFLQTWTQQYFWKLDFPPPPPPSPMSHNSGFSVVQTRQHLNHKLPYYLLTLGKISFIRTDLREIYSSVLYKHEVSCLQCLCGSAKINITLSHPLLWGTEVLFDVFFPFMFFWRASARDAMSFRHGANPVDWLEFLGSLWSPPSSTCRNTASADVLVAKWLFVFCK